LAQAPLVCLADKLFVARYSGLLSVLRPSRSPFLAHPRIRSCVLTPINRVGRLQLFHRAVHIP
jgi:hypothetical protein